VKDIKEAMILSNEYAPEHLILQLKDAASVVDLVQNAGSVFIGEWTPESVGDYSAGVNHSLRKLFQLLLVALELTTCSNLWIRKAVLWCEPRLIYEAYHEFKPYGTGVKKRRWGGDAARQSGRAGSTPKSGQHQD
jgi:phosphoribosyl-ATP pyrophosphohydrolase/phosphoribosyl-AMP cyclohydrolase/histidinol dehydrogenase